MANAIDVAAYILEQHGEMSTYKLQKLVYYSQAWHLAWEEEPLFDDPIEAWANGPVTPSLYREHRGRFSIGPRDLRTGDPHALTPNERDTVDLVLRDYGRMTGRQLSQLTHSEAPWQDARGPISPTAASNAIITPESLYEFYSALDADADAQSVDAIDWDSLESA